MTEFEPTQPWSLCTGTACCLAARVLVAISLAAGASLGLAQSVVQPRIQNMSVVQGTNSKTFRMWIPTQAGVNYTAERTSQTAPALWTVLTNFPGSGTLDPATDRVGSGSTRFYRVAVDPQPWIRNQPRSRAASAGETLQIDVLATGMLPLAYQWFGPSGVIADGARVNGSTTASLSLSSLEPGDEGNYWVTVTNFYGSTSSVPVGVIITLSQAPRILIDPQSQSLLVGQSVSLFSSAGGELPLSYRWFGPAGVLSDGGRVTGSATTTLAITGLQLIDSGGYYMTVSNSFGSATSAVATVTVQPGQPPRITLDPLSQLVTAGQTLNLQVTANGTPTLNYQWYGPSGSLSNGGRFSGTLTANLAISNFQAADNGDYYVIVTNAYGTATSVSANVTAQ